LGKNGRFWWFFDGQVVVKCVVNVVCGRVLAGEKKYATNFDFIFCELRKMLS